MQDQPADDDGRSRGGRTPSDADGPAGPAGPGGPVHAPAGVAAERAAGRRITPAGIVVGVVIGLALGIPLGAAVPSPWGAAGDGRAAAGTDRSGPRDAALVTLLEDVDRAERVMLAYDDAASRAFLGFEADPVTTLAAVAEAASEAVGALGSLRDRFVAPSGEATVEAVRAAYLPHLDSWAAYLGAVATDPGVVLDEGRRQPLVLVINATAAVFADALEDLIATAPAPEVAALAARILDQGFRRDEGTPDL
jgi:hypothetical protein